MLFKIFFNKENTNLVDIFREDYPALLGASLIDCYDFLASQMRTYDTCYSYRIDEKVYDEYSKEDILKNQQYYREIPF